MAQSYKCPACGAPIEYNAQNQNFTCEYCLKQFTEQQMIDYFAAQDKQAEERAMRDAAEEQARQASSAAGSDNVHVNSYHCNSCGAEVVTDSTTQATFCYYCHSPVVITDRLVGNFKPDQMIPFSTDKTAANNAFLAWVGKKRYVPGDFAKKQHCEKMTGIYLPYWFTDCNVNFNYSAIGESVRTWRVGNTEYIETTTRRHTREGSMFLDDTSIPSYSKVDNDLLNSICNYPLNEMRPFAMPMLSGFFSDQREFDGEAAKKPLADQAHGYALGKVQQSTQNSDVIVNEDFNFDIRPDQPLYTLLPTWMLTYNYLGKIYTFAMNGNTGEVYGELPVNKGAILRDSLIASAVVFVALLLGGIFLW